jgi:hypothetical protein
MTRALHSTGARVRVESKVQRRQVHNRACPHDQGEWMGVAAGPEVVKSRT